MVSAICMARVFLVSLVGCLLMVACSSPENRGETSKADIDEVIVSSPQTPPLRVRVTVHGFLTNGCERLGEVTQRLEGRTFFVEVMKVYERPAGVSCHTGVTEFEKEVVLEVAGLADGVYTANVNGVTETFELEGEGVFVEGGGASLSGVDAQVLASSTEVSGISGIKVGVFIEGELADPCVELRGVKQTREGNTFKLDLETWLQADVACLPVTEFFWEFVLLEPQDLVPGTYQVEVSGSNTVTASFKLHPDATYREAKVTGLEIIPVESFTANVVVRGELQSSCEVIDGAVEQREGTDRDALPDEAFFITLVSRVTGSCGDKTVPFEEVIPISSYGSGDYTVDVNGVVESFTFPGAEPFTRP